MNSKEIHHVDPQQILVLAEKPEILETNVKGAAILEVARLTNGKEAYLVRNFHQNFAHASVDQALKRLTGYSSSELHQIVESIIPHKTTGLKRAVGSFIGRGGDSLILDPQMKDKNVESLIVGELTIGKDQPISKKAEWALVRIWDYGALKCLVLPAGNPGSEIEWEMALSLNGGLSYIIPRDTKISTDMTVTQDNGVKMELNSGDAVFLPLTPRQVISTNPQASQEKIRSGSRYLAISPAWGGDVGVSQQPIYWKSQV